MRTTHEEPSHYSEIFPNLDQGGNLLFNLYANREKLKSIVETGIKPRGGRVKAGSFFPHAVSLSATAPRGRIWELEDAMKAIAPTLILDVLLSERTQPPYFKYAIVLDPEWLQGHIDGFRGVGEQIRSKHFKDVLRINALRRLSISKVPYNIDEAHNNEVHYLDGVLPPVSFVGVINNSKDLDAWRADVMIKDVVRELRQDTTGPHMPLALYSREGLVYDVL